MDDEIEYVSMLLTFLRTAKDNWNMSALGLLRTLFNYQAWANDEFLEKMEDFDPELHREQHHAAMRLILASK